MRVEQAQQVEQVAARRKVAAVGPEVHARHGGLLEPGRGHLVELGRHARERHAAPRAARRRDDAVGARLVAARLHAQRVAGAAGRPRPDHLAARAVAAAEPLGRRALERQPQAVGQLLLVAVVDDLRDARQRRDLGRRPTGIAAGGDNARRGVRAGDAPDGLPRALVGRRRHRATVHHDQIGFAGPTGRPPRARSWRSMPTESAWFTRQPKVTTAYFIGPQYRRPRPRRRCTAAAHRAGRLTGGRGAKAVKSARRRRRLGACAVERRGLRKARTARLGGSGAGRRGPRKRTPGVRGAAPSD